MRYSVTAGPDEAIVQQLVAMLKLAERGGFEPPVEFLTLRRFSKPLLSTTQPPLRGGQVRYFKNVSMSGQAAGTRSVR